MRKRQPATLPIHAPARRVVVALRMAGIAGQDKLNGVFEHLSDGHRWQLAIYRTRHEFTAETVRSEIARGAEGFIVGIPDADDALAALAESEVPTVLVNVPPAQRKSRRHNFALVCSDAESVGREAAITLLRQGVFKCYAYAGYRLNADWSRDRGRAFRDTLEKSGFIGRMFDLDHFQNRLDDRATLLKWLRELPKPCGMLAACDDRAFEILDVCQEAGIKVPSEIAVLGVNNDPLLCENASPRLSSVQPDFVREGRLAAELLDQLMAHPERNEKISPPPLEIQKYLVGIKAVVHRESTLPLSPSGLLVQKALSFIHANALKGIGVADVARHLKVSRELIGLRFRELHHEPVYETILRLRLDEVKRRLRSTRDPIGAISADCGWKNVNALKNLFLRRFGCSMRDYRNGG